MTNQTPEGEQRRSWVLLLLFIASVASGFLIYLGALKNEFVWDDPIVLGQQLQAFHSLRDLFFPPARIPQFGHLYYRPLIMVSYVIDRWIWGDTSFGFHFPVVLFHAINSGLVFLVGRRLFGSVRGSTLAALSGAVLFATHPIHTESVNWMAGRSDTLATLFLLPALLSYLAWKRGRRPRGFFLALALLLFLLACFAKESALGLIFIIAAIDGLGMGEEERGSNRRESLPVASAGRGRSAAAATAPSHGRRPREKGGASGKGVRASETKGSGSAPPKPSRPIAGWLGLAAASAVYFFIRQSALAEEASPLRMQNPDLLASALNIVKAVGFYFIKIFLPTHLDAYIPKIPNPGLSLALGVLGPVAALVLGVYAWRRGEKLIALFIAWFFGALAPSLSIAWFQISEAPVAERYLYLPSAGFCLLIGYLALVKLPASLPQNARRAAFWASATVVAALSAAYAVGTVERSKVWRSDLDFWKDGVAKSPDEGLPHLHLGLAYNNLKMDDLAEKEYKLALEVNYDDEGRSIACNNLGMLYSTKKEFDQADQFFQQGIRMRSDYATPYYGLGITAFRRAQDAVSTGQMAEASRQFAASERALRRAIELNPQYVKAYGVLGQLLHMAGRDREAMSSLSHVFRLVSRGPEYEAALNVKKAVEEDKGAQQGEASPGSSPR